MDCHVKGMSLKLSADRLKKMDTDTYIIIDVRCMSAWSNGYIQGAWILAEERLSQVIKSFITDKQTKIVLYCDNGEISRQKTNLIRSLGYEESYYLEGGLIAWCKAGGAITVPELVVPEL
tara:strand:- start:534 stop:893 length:360 start_codon:yes stop_codon:yes gene_type:complete